VPGLKSSPSLPPNFPSPPERIRRGTWARNFKLSYRKTYPQPAPSRLQFRDAISRGSALVLHQRAASSRDQVKDGTCAKQVAEAALPAGQTTRSTSFPTPGSRHRAAEMQTSGNVWHGKVHLREVERNADRTFDAGKSKSHPDDQFRRVSWREREREREREK